LKLEVALDQRLLKLSAENGGVEPVCATGGESGGRKCRRLANFPGLVQGSGHERLEIVG
jgi:hypothetical protein